MSVQALRDLRKSIVNHTFAPAYYFHGEDEYRKEAAVRELVEGALDPATRDFNFDLLRGADVSDELLESALNTPPMMAERRVVILRDVGALKKDARVVLERYLRHPARDTVLAIVAAPDFPGGTKGDKDFDASLNKSATPVAFPVLADKPMLEWLVQHAHKAHGVSITDGAAALLLEHVGADSSQLASELDKLTSYTQAGTIDEQAVRDVVGIRLGVSMSDLLDRIAERNAPAALALIDPVMALPKSGLVPIIIALSVQTLAIAWGRAARDRGLPAQRMESDFFGLLKETRAFPMRPWSAAAKCWARNVARWDAASLDRALAALRAADRAAKDTRISSDEQLLASLVLTLCTPAQRSAA
ncbi:MAG: DNA polymerase III subunit delta [Gemmatimonadota bacterium]